ncbi:MAG: helix-turn-helix transcriptional regulator [Deltaproteobacteria bacterium]|nr:helix-turn-helix transcriptional regulator [Deltaproteobacteria bacterium]
MADIESTSYTKQRILDAAEALFAEKGYKAVTVREIVKTAGCNIAAVKRGACICRSLSTGGYQGPCGFRRPLGRTWKRAVR